MAAGNFRIRDLELIVALHEAGNMTQAAKRLGISEPALSKQLQKIESWVQAPLFERGNGGMVAFVHLDEGIAFMEVDVVVVSREPTGCLIGDLVCLGSECLVLHKAAEWLCVAEHLAETR